MEQSYKEKYEDILARLERAKNDNEVCDERFCCVIDVLIPELAESEDERVRKEIINYFQCQSEEEPTRKEVHNKWIAWLERQGDYANFRDKAQVGDRITKNEDGVLVNLSQLNRVAKPKENKGNIGGISANWSEEDEMFVHGLIRGLAAKRDIHGHTTFSSDCIDITETIDWLKSLQDRVQPQPKQEWSDEDEDYLFLLNSICKDAEEKYRNSPDVLVRKEIANARNWLKSLRPHNRWKPSSEQIGLLQAIINEPNNATSESCQIVLKDILEQLKKLKEGKV